ncbi:hypothetical protein M885DRAFT_531479 [Pelagophyceae sp. CCMP2097]|nr:hypothetical protein M885DRAFT_531479 [Pelagophyceae sp. CCMP2097]
MSASSPSFGSEVFFPAKSAADSHALRHSDHLGTYEHDSWYRMSYWTTNEAKTLGAGDRCYVGTADARHRAGIGLSRREPWYGGAVPTGVPTTAPFADAQRYGARGAMNERAYRLYANSAPHKTYRADTPKFLRQKSVVDEWTPPLKASPMKPGGFTLATPRLWPDNAQYVSGYRGTEPGSPGASVARPVSSWYGTQTTASASSADDDRDVDDHLRRVADLEVTLARQLRRASVMERAAIGRAATPGVTFAEGTSRGAASRGAASPASQRPRRATTAALGGAHGAASSRVRFSVIGGEQRAVAVAEALQATKASAAAAAAALQQLEAFQKTSLSKSAAAVQHADEGHADCRSVVFVRYSGPQTMLVASGARAYDIDVTSSDLFRFELRWQEVARLHRNILFDKASPSPAKMVDELTDSLRHCAAKRANASQVPRDDFVETLELKVDQCSRGRANLVFSAFDSSKRQLVEYADFIGCLLVLARSDWSPIEALVGLWRLQFCEASNKSTMQRLDDIFGLCAQSKAQLQAIHHLVAAEVLPQLTRAVLLRPLDDVSASDASTAVSTSTADARTLRPDDIFAAAPASESDFRSALAHCSQAVRLWAQHLGAARQLVSSQPGSEPAPQDRRPSVGKRVALLKEQQDQELNPIRPTLRTSTRLRSM